MKPHIQKIMDLMEEQIAAGNTIIDSAKAVAAQLAKTPASVKRAYYRNRAKSSEHAGRKLSESSEKTLWHVLAALDRKSKPLSNSGVIELVQKHFGVKVSEGWVRRFKKRNENTSLDEQTMESIGDLFKELEEKPQEEIEQPTADGENDAPKLRVPVKATEYSINDLVDIAMKQGKEKEKGKRERDGDQVEIEKPKKRRKTEEEEEVTVEEPQIEEPQLVIPMEPTPDKSPQDTQ